MKKFLVLLVAILQTFNVFCQWVEGNGVITTSDEVVIDGNTTIANKKFYRSLRTDGSSHQAFGMDNNNDIVFNRSALVALKESGLIFGAADRPIDFRDKNNSIFMRITSSGNVGIGTGDPQSKLSIKGKAEAEEIQVKQTVADYVFKDGYNLMSLEDLSMFIQENGHLPNIQNDESVANNRGFVKLGELSISLMEKVEELTLHIINLNKRISDLESKE